MTLRDFVEEAEAIVRRLFPEDGSEPQGLKLELVRVIRKAELRGYQECLQTLGIEPEAEGVTQQEPA